MDYIINALAEKTIQIKIGTTKNLVNHALAIHRTTPVVTAALGRLLTAAAIMGSLLKNETDLLTLSIRGDGALKGLTATADSRCRVKGYAFVNRVDLPLKNGKLDVKTALGKGILAVTKDIGLKEPVSGQVPLISGEIAEDLTYYYAKSEQIPTSVALGVLTDGLSVKQAGGFIIQLLPHTPEELTDRLEQKLANIPPLTKMLSTKTPEEILAFLFENHNIEILGKSFPKYYCNCNRNKTTKALMAIGEEELSLILKEDGKANIHCHFCVKDYGYTRKDIEKLLTREV